MESAQRAAVPCRPVAPCAPLRDSDGVQHRVGRPRMVEAIRRPVASVGARSRTRSATDRLASHRVLHSHREPRRLALRMPNSRLAESRHADRRVGGGHPGILACSARSRPASFPPVRLRRIRSDVAIGACCWLAAVDIRYPQQPTPSPRSSTMNTTPCSPSEPSRPTDIVTRESSSAMSATANARRSARRGGAALSARQGAPAPSESRTARARSVTGRAPPSEGSDR
jgi:hypothetical protein